MSSIVSRSPPPSGSTSQENDFFWMSIRLGTSRTLPSRAKLRRGGGASTEAKTATPQGGSEDERADRPRELEALKARPAKIAQGQAYPCEGRSALTDPVLSVSRMWREGLRGRLRLSAESRECSGPHKRGRRGRIPRRGDGESRGADVSWADRSPH